MTTITTHPQPVRSRPRGFFTFPDPVNETAVRVTAAGVAVLALTAVVTGRGEPLVLLAYGFVARALAGPRLSPLALFATRVVAPRLSPRPVPGPPKRFAQALGALASTAAVATYYAGAHRGAWVLAGLIVLLATLESALRICVGCVLYGALVRRGLIRGEDCPECSDISGRIGLR